MPISWCWYYTIVLQDVNFGKLGNCYMRPLTFFLTTAYESIIISKEKLNLKTQNHRKKWMDISPFWMEMYYMWVTVLLQNVFFLWAFKQLLNLSNINCIICVLIWVIRADVWGSSKWFLLLYSRPSHKTPRLFNQPPYQTLIPPYPTTSLYLPFRFCNYVIQSFLHLAGIKALP